MHTDKEITVFWLIVVSAVAGLLLGLRFKVAALIATSGFVLIIDCIAAFAGGWRFLDALVLVVVSLLAIQLAYAIGLFIGYCCRSSGKSTPLQD
jgi:hypothetical protein